MRSSGSKPDWNEAGPDGQVQVHELVAADPRARAALWTFMLTQDLVSPDSWRLGPSTNRCGTC